MFLDSAVRPLHPAPAPLGRAPASDGPPPRAPRPGDPDARGEGGARKLKRSYVLWEDQAEALVLASSLASIGRRDRGAGTHGTEMSEIVRALLDIHGYDRAFVDGTGVIR